MTANSKVAVATIKTLHDGTQADVDDTNQKCAALFDIEKIFLDGSYATDANTVRTNVKSFTDAYGVKSAEFGAAFNEHQKSYDALYKLACDFEKKNDLSCRSSFFLKGCEAKLNAMRCEIAALLKFIKAKRENALAHIKGMKGVLTKANKHVDSFVCDNNLKAANPGPKLDYCKLKAATTQFFTEFNENHWGGHANFLNLRYVSDQVTAKISLYTDKYISNCKTC